MITVKTIDGQDILINPAHIVMAAHIASEGIPVLGQCRIMLLGGIGLMLNHSLEEVREKIHGTV